MKVNHKEIFASVNKNKEKLFWTNKLSKFEFKTIVPNNFYNPDKIKDRKYGQLKFEIPNKIFNRLIEISNDVNNNLFIILFSEIVLLSSKILNKNDVIIACPVLKQNNENIINRILPIRNSFKGDISYKDLLKKTKENVVEAFDNQEYSIYSIIRDLGLPENENIVPLFDIAVLLDNIHDKEYLSNINFNLIFQFNKTNSGIQGIVEYNQENIVEDFVKNLISYFNNILEQTLHSLDIKLFDIEIISENEKQHLLVEFNKTEVAYPSNKSIYQLFEEQVERTPNNVALITGDRNISYLDFNKMSNKLALILRQYGICSESIVSLLVDRSVEMMVGIMGILKAGGAYLPIDPEYPIDRINFILSDSNSKVLLLQKEEKEEIKCILPIIVINSDLSTKEEYPNLNIETNSRDLAYVIYTSGSTGNPKGVMIENHSVVNRLKWMQNSYPIGSNDILIQKTPYTFDVSVWELFWWSFEGSSLVLLEKGGEKDPSKLVECISENNVSIIHFVPSMLDIFLDNVIEYKQQFLLGSLRYVFASGEELKIKHVNKFYEGIEKQSDSLLVNLYGPTEATVDVTYFNCNRIDQYTSIPIGKPIDNTQIYILDSTYYKLQAIGVPGELCIAGVGLARGYLKRPDLTKTQFIENPYNHGTKLYKTGDLARWLPDGNIEYMGRIDSQVKIRGFRIELGEIESALLKHESITEAIVIAREDAENNKYLCAYVVLIKAECGVANLDLASFLLVKLPEYMIPSYFIEMDTIPLTSNGKLNRKSLPEPTIKAGDDYESPKNATEKILVKIWSEVLNIQEEEISTNALFFKIGGHSLRITILASRIHKEFDIKLLIKDLYKNQTIKEQSALIANSIISPFEPIVKAKEKSQYIVSSSQKRLYLLQQFDLNSKIYNISGLITIPPSADKNRVENALHKIIIRHESFRTSFDIIDELIVQVIHDEVLFKLEELHIEKVDFDRVQKDFIRPFDLTQPPLLRALLLRVGSNESYLLIDMHHIISDGISLVILENDFKNFYEGNELAPLSLQYKDYSEWQNSKDQQERIKLQSFYWLDKFSEDIPVLDLHQDFSRPVIQIFEGSNVSFRLRSEETKIIKDLCTECNITLYMSLLGVFNILLSRLSGQTDIIVGTPIAARRHSDLENIVGMFVNTLALRNYTYPEKCLRDFYEDIKSTTLEAYENQEYQFEDLVDSVNSHRDISRNPLFDVALNLLNQTVSGGFENEESGILIHKKGISKFDLTLTAIETGNQLEFNLEYSTSLFRSSTINRFIGYLRELISSIGRGLDVRISELNMITSSEKKEILYDFNKTVVAYPSDKSIHQLFEEQVSKNPDSIALVFDDTELTYRELNKRSNQLAGKLKLLGLEKDSCIGLMTDRSFQMLIGILGILKSACYYMPIDINFPDLRKQYMLKDGNINLVLTQKAYLNSVKGKYQVLDLENEDIYKGLDINVGELSSSGDLAYVMYTSGSTGNSKGVMVEHKNVIRLIVNTNYIKLTKETKILQTGAIVFDATTFEIWGALLNGGSLFLTSAEDILNPRVLNKNLENHNINTLWLSSSLFNQLLDQDESLFKNLTYLLVGGDKLSAYHINKVRRANRDLKVINGYGPTENTTFSACYLIEKDFENNIPIGKPINNTTAYILDCHNKIQAIGVAGELYFGLDGVSRGYLNNQELTDCQFIDNPYMAGGKLYRTGDLARWLSDGNIEFLGRIDSQVKIRGFRVESGEIEDALLMHESIREVAVIAREDSGNNKYLCAYIVLGVNAPVIESLDLRGFLSISLPEYMIPAYFIEIESIPLNSNGKINKKSLPEPIIKVGDDFEGPQNTIEKILVKIWSDILEVERNAISINVNFFELGGHSLKAVKIISNINSEFKCDISFVKIFIYPTIKKFGEYLNKKIASKENIVNAIEKKEYYELSSAQKRLFFIQELKKNSTSYNMPFAYIIHGDIDKIKFEDTCSKIIQRHEALRASFVQINSNPVQIIHDKLKPLINFIDTDIKNENLVIENCIKSFDLNIAPLFRIYLIRTSENRHVFLIDMHHIISDGTSLELIISDFNNIYKGNILPSLPIQYKDYAVWYNEFLNSETVKKQEKFWIKQFEDKVPKLNLPTDFSWEDKKNNNGRTIYHSLDKDLVDSLKEFLVVNETTIFQFLLSVYNILLSKCSSQDDIVIGSPIANRKEKNSQNIIGLFVNMISFRNYPKGNVKYCDFLTDLKCKALNVFSNQDYPFEKLVSKLKSQGNSNRHPIFDAVLAILNIEFESNKIANSISIEPFVLNKKVVQHDLLLSAFFANNIIELSLDYSSELFKEETVKKLMDYLVIIIEQVIMNKEIKIEDISLPHSLLETVPSDSRQDNDDFVF